MFMIDFLSCKCLRVLVVIIYRILCRGCQSSRTDRCFIQADPPEQRLRTQTHATRDFSFIFYLCTLSRGYTGFLNLSLAGCTSDKDCPLTTACIAATCQEPCLHRNPCVKNAVCVNSNHRAECSCNEGYHGNGFLYCALGNYSIDAFDCQMNRTYRASDVVNT